MKRVLSRPGFCLVIAMVCLMVYIAAGCAGPSSDTEKPQSQNNNSSTSGATSPATSPPKAAARPATGGIQITSRPDGATVLLMATDEGGSSPPEPRGTTPLTLENLEPGKYAVHLELKGYKAFQKEVEVKAGEVLPIVAALKK